MNIQAALNLHEHLQKAQAMSNGELGDELHIIAESLESENWSTESIASLVEAARRLRKDRGKS